MKKFSGYPAADEVENAVQEVADEQPQVGHGDHEERRGGSHPGGVAPSFECRLSPLAVALPQAFANRLQPGSGG